MASQRGRSGIESKLKIAVVSGDDVCPDRGEGMRWQCELLCAALAADGNTVVAYVRQDDHLRDTSDQGYRLVLSGVGPSAPATAAHVLPFMGEWAEQLDELWAADPPDVVHAFGWLGGLAAQLAARRRGLPVVQSFHAAPGPADTQRARLEPLLIRGAEWVTAGSTGELGALARLRGSRARVSMLPNGVDAKRFTPSGPAPKSPAQKTPAQKSAGLLRVLQLEPNTMPCNGFEKTIRALAKVADTELILAETDPAGSRPNRELVALKRLAADLGVKDRVKFMGAVACEDIPSLLHSADVVACTPLHAPRATTALRAMASGVVVVAVAVDALIDTVINGVTGLLVSPTDPNELASALKYFHNQRFQRESMGSAGRSRALSRFTWDRIALDAQRIYHQAIPANVAPPRAIPHSTSASLRTTHI